MLWGCIEQLMDAGEMLYILAFVVIPFDVELLEEILSGGSVLFVVAPALLNQFQEWCRSVGIDRRSHVELRYLYYYHHIWLTC
jgi:hypothetical protein